MVLLRQVCVTGLARLLGRTPEPTGPRSKRIAGFLLGLTSAQTRPPKE